MTFLLDNCISPKFAKALSALDRDVRALRDEFASDIQDTRLLAELGSRGWAFVTTDKRILTRPQEVVALRLAKITTFFLGHSFLSLGFWEQAIWLVKHWPRFENMAQTIDRGTCFVVKQNGKMNAVSP